MINVEFSFAFVTCEYNSDTVFGKKDINKTDCRPTVCHEPAAFLPFPADDPLEGSNWLHVWKMDFKTLPLRIIT